MYLSMLKLLRREELQTVPKTVVFRDTRKTAKTTEAIMRRNGNPCKRASSGTSVGMLDRCTTSLSEAGGEKFSLLSSLEVTVALLGEISFSSRETPLTFEVVMSGVC